MSDESYTCENVDGISYDEEGNSLNVNYTDEEVAALEALEQYIFNGEQTQMTREQLKDKLENVKNALKQKGIDENSNKFIIELVIHKWYCYCMHDKIKDSKKKNECMFRKQINIDILNGIINEIFSPRKRGEVVTKPPQKLQTGSGGDQTGSGGVQTGSGGDQREAILMMLNEEIYNNLANKRKKKVKKQFKTPNPDKESDEESEYIVLRF